MLKTPVVVGGARTPTGKFGKTLADLEAVQLGAAALKEAVRRSGLNPEDIGEVIIGAHLQAGARSNPARQCAIAAGLPVTTPAFTPNKNCATALKAIQLAAQSIMLGENTFVAAGGCESMSRVPYLLKNARFGYRLGSGEILDSMLYDALVDPFENYHMGITAENVAEKYGVTRREQDELALRSHRLAQAAWEAGRFDADIAPVTVKQRRETIEFKKDETYIENAEPGYFEKAKPAFKENGMVTAANASPINDGAAVLVLADEAAARTKGLPLLAKYVCSAAAAIEPAYMGYAPVAAVEGLLKKAGLTVADIDLWEVNEAFAAQAVAVCRGLGLPMDKVNVNGGAIALGHPVGSTGARLALTLISEMRRRSARYGVVTLCIGGGQGLATLFELMP